MEHDANHGEADEGDDGSGAALEVARQAAVSIDPGESALGNPSFGQDDEAVCVAALDDLQGPAAGVGDGLGDLWPLVGGIGGDTLDEGKGAPGPSQYGGGAIAILHVGGMEDSAQQEGECVDEDVSLASCDLLARIEVL